MFSLSPYYGRGYDNSGLLRLLDEVTNSPILYNNSSVANLSGRLGDSEIQNTDKEFRIRMDLRHYSPEEVKITSDSEKIVVKAKHEEKQDNYGYVSREMIRTYKMPEDVDVKSVTSTMNSQGTLFIKVAKKAIEGSKETQIPINFKE